MISGHRTTRYLLLAGLIFTGGSAFAGESTFEGSCAGVGFRVLVVQGEHPLDNTYTLSVLGGQAANVIHRSAVGGFFEVACLSTRSGRPLLVFQAYCGGSACIEDKYGVFDPASRKLLLLPGEKNVSNRREVQALLGLGVPRLSDVKGRLCCEP